MWFKNIPTPAYVADIQCIKKNLDVVKHIKQSTGCQVILATKAFSMFSLFPLMRDILDGTTASGIYEARLGYEEFGKDVHVYSPAFSEHEIAELLPICRHISFNSVKQLENYAPLFKKSYQEKAVVGLRINPKLSLVQNSSLYDPSAENSRLGEQIEKLTLDVINQINLIHVHNLCENLADSSTKLIDHLTQKIPDVLQKVNYLNIGGGHYITHPDYDVEQLIEVIQDVQKEFNLQVILEPGGAIVYDSGYLVSKVLDIINTGKKNIAILDTSATCHMPDVLEVPYRPIVKESGESEEFEYNYIFAGRTCLAGDVIGEYSFKSPLEIGSKIVFRDMMQYTMVKNSTFNGMPLPDIGVIDNGEYKIIKQFDYQDFKSRLS